MKPNNHLKIIAASIALIMAIWNAPTLTAEEDGDLEKKYERLKEQLEQISEEMNALKEKINSEESQGDGENAPGVRNTLLEGEIGNSIYHVGGYADVMYSDSEGGIGNFATGHFAPIFHWQYKDIILFESELAFGIESLEETGETETETELEYMSLDLFLNDYMTLVAGKFLSPIGQFQQNLHPSWINKLPSAPIGFGTGHHSGASEAAPIADVGVQLRGGVPLNDMRFNYALVVGNGPRIVPESHDSEEGDAHEAEEHDEEENHDGENGHEEEEEHNDEFEIGGLDTSGSVHDLNENKSFGGRFGFLPIPNLELGLSGLTAKATYVGMEHIGEMDYNVFGADFYYAPGYVKNLSFRGEFVRTELDGGLEEKDKTWEAFYVQGAYFLENLKLEPVLRYGEYRDGHDELQKQYALGLNYWWASNVITKLAYEFNDSSDAHASADRVSLQLAYGF